MRDNHTTHCPVLPGESVSLRLSANQLIRIINTEGGQVTDKNERGYELNISSITGNLGTGKKKGQMASFDLAYIQSSDYANIDCLHFILQDQMENVHDNHISNLMTEIISEVRCQYIMPLLKDKLPDDIDIKTLTVLTLSQNDKLFRV